MRAPSCCLHLSKALTIAAGCLISFAFSDEAQAANRSLTLYNTHTKETTTITYKRGGRFDAAGLRKLNRFLRDWRRNEIIQMDPALFDLIWQVYKETGARKPIHVVSGYRSPATNNMLRKRSRGVAKQSRHTRGQAMDFYLPGVSVKKIREVGLRMQAGGVGYYPRSNSPFVHIDTGNVRHWPRMTRKQLARVFPRGNTVHVPTDGKPFKGYKQAKAKVARRKVQMAKASRSVGRFTQIVKAAPTKPSRTQLASTSQLQRAKLARVNQDKGQSNSFLGNLLSRTPQKRPTPAAAPNIAAPAPVELAPSAPAAPILLAVAPKPRAPQPRPQLSLTPAPIDLASADQPQDQLPEQQPEPIQLAALPKARQAPFQTLNQPAAPSAQRRFVLATGPAPAQFPTIDPTPVGSIVGPDVKATQDKPEASEKPASATRLQLASLPKNSPERQELLSSFATVPNKPAANQAKPDNAQAALTQLARATPQPALSDNRFAYAPQPSPLSRVGQANNQDKNLQLASLPTSKPAKSSANPRSVPKPHVTDQRSQQASPRSRDQLTKLTFAYGPASMAHFAHMKQPTQTATFARLSRPAPNRLAGLVAKPVQLVDQRFSHQPINLSRSNKFAGRAVASVAIRKFN